ncbi:MAG: hypothetical protein JRI85_16885 [Deltaproteobacteria bacterium]|nr:hypothetical protein [Deltaproteobacteria bacterium]
MEVTKLYKSRYRNFTVRHFYSWYRRLHGGRRSYAWVKKTLQAQGVVKKAPRRDTHINNLRLTGFRAFSHFFYPTGFPLSRE